MVLYDDKFAKTYAGIYAMIGTPGAAENGGTPRAVRKQRDAEGGVPYGNSRHIRRYDGRAGRLAAGSP
ncbi:MAG: hypothetical protein LBS45_05770 [Synergistaceae bacterium]|jgi:hypothetical protein|nr:hypothetical protein [Synergistaceae bacterium]